MKFENESAKIGEKGMFNPPNTARNSILKTSFTAQQATH